MKKATTPVYVPAHMLPRRTQNGMKTATTPVYVPESGTGVIGTMFGAVVFLSFVAVAVHTLIGLYTTSVVTAVTFDEVSQVASGVTTQDSAEIETRQRLSSLRDLALSWDNTQPDVLSLTVSGRRPVLLPKALAGTSLSTINRTITVKREHAHAET